MSIQEVSPEQLAELFHHYHQVLAPDFGCAKDDPEALAWNEVSAAERHRLIAAARLALTELAATSPKHEERRRYFAKPGEAEWGC